MLEAAVQDLKRVIAERDGTNAANRAFAVRVQELISAFYDDICEITNVSTRTLFDLFVIKVLYVERSSTDAGVIDYLGRLLERYLDARELFPASPAGRASPYYFSDLLREGEQLRHFQNLFEAYRKYGDHSLFVTGIFPRALSHRGGGRTPARTGFVDRSYHVTSGRRFYHLAAQHELAESTQQRALLEKLSTYFDVYREALSEMSEQYIMGFDFSLIADKMLDSFNRYRRTGQERSLQNARRYAAILRIDAGAFPSLLKLGMPGGHPAQATAAY